MSRLAQLEDLLARALEDVRSNLASAVECCTSMDASDSAPIPGTCLPNAVDQFREVIALVRDIEAAIGRFEEHPEPQWFDDLIDGKWVLVESDCPGHVASAADAKICGRCGTHVDEMRPDADPFNPQGSGPAQIVAREG